MGYDLSAEACVATVLPPGVKWTGATPTVVNSQVPPGFAPPLPAGATVELTATGTAIAGQYENTVIATAENPLDPGTELQAADTSWHYGCGRDRAAEAGVDRL